MQALGGATGFVCWMVSGNCQRKAEPGRNEEMMALGVQLAVNGNWI